MKTGRVKIDVSVTKEVNLADQIGEIVSEDIDDNGNKSYLVQVPVNVYEWISESDLREIK